ANRPTAKTNLKRSQLAQEISNQADQLQEIVEEMKTLSEQAEPSEPILSDSLYDAVRNTMMNGVEDSLEEARDYTFYNRPTQALGPQEAATRGIEELKENVEAAAEKVLGNEADALRLARSELDRLIEESKQEAQQLAQNEKAEATESRQKSSEQSDSEQGDGKPQEEGEGSEQAAAEKGKGQRPGNGEEPGEGVGNGTEKSDGKMAGKGKTPGSGESESETEGQGGKGKGKGKGSGEEGESQLAGSGQAGGGIGEDSGKGKGGERGGENNVPPSGSSSGVNGGSLGQAGGDDRNNGMREPSPKTATPLFFDQISENPQTGPITGDGYKEFRDSLGNIEEMIPQEDLRNQVARVADEARQMRVEFSRDNLPPGAASIDQKITQPLLELRQRLSEELAKLNRENPIAPIDRDPVPSEFRDLVRRYYEELGSGN
ncbi:MAG: hypothetical protein AAF357_06280, partial [Verrucomicrobiota bacterium]